MSYRSRRQGRSSRYSRTSNPVNVRGIGNRGDNYSLNQTGGRRHELMQEPVRGDSQAWLPNESVGIVLCQMQRAFNADDTPPTPTAGNNYQNISVMNGSTIDQYKAKIRLLNSSGSSSTYIDVYTIELSFYEALIWDTVDAGGLSHVNFDQATPDRQGETTFKQPLPTLTANQYKNFKFTHHYMKHQGTIFLSSEDGSPAQGEINFSRVPPKVKRMQTGAFWGVVLTNDSIKNDGATLNVDISTEFSFMEHPTDNRLPYIY